MTTDAKQVPIELCGGPLDGERRVIWAPLRTLDFPMMPTSGDPALWPPYQYAHYQGTRERNSRGEIIYRFAGIRP